MQDYVRVCMHVSMYVCIGMYYVDMYDVCIIMYVCIYLRIFVCMYVFVGMYVFMYVCMYYVGMFVCMYVCMNVCMCVCMYACVYVCIYVCMYVVCVCVYYEGNSKSTSDCLVKKVQSTEQNCIICYSYTHNCTTSPHSCHPHLGTCRTATLVFAVNRQRKVPRSYAARC